MLLALIVTIVALLVLVPRPVKQLTDLQQFRLRGQTDVSAVVGLHVIAYNLIRLGNLLGPVEAVG